MQGYGGSYRQSESVVLRKKQIGTLSDHFKQHLIEVQRDVVYEILVKAVQGQNTTVTLRVTLPEQFPYSPPILSVIPAINHPMITSTGVVIPGAHESLKNWTIRNNLGKLVLEVITGVITQAGGGAASNGHGSNYAAQPPGSNQRYAPPGSNHGPVPPPQSYGSTPQQPLSNGGPSSAGKAAQFEEFSVPPPPTSFPELEGKSLEELQILLNDEDQMRLFVEDLEFIKGLKKLRDDARESSAKQARENLEKEQELQQVQAVLESKAGQLRELRSQYESQLQLQRDMMQKYAPEALLALLYEAANAAEAETEKMSSDFLNGDMPLKEFLQQYQERRTVYHLRAAKLETIQRSMG